MKIVTSTYSRDTKPGGLATSGSGFTGPDRETGDRLSGSADRQAANFPCHPGQRRSSRGVVARAAGLLWSLALALPAHGTVAPLASNSGNEYRPQINKVGQVVWCGLNGARKDIFLWWNGSN